MKKLLLLPLALILCVACSVEEETSLDPGADLTVVVENYKGIFTTTDGQSRGKLDVTLSQDSKTATANLTLSSGETISVSTDQITDLGNAKEMTFTSTDLTFKMVTAEEGETMQIDAVTFRGSESSILAGRNTERTPLSTILGTYTCTANCPTFFNTGTQTFNVMLSNPGGTDASVTSQTTLASTVFAGVATQSNCNLGAGTNTQCTMRSGTVVGSIGPGYNPNGGGNVFWTGTHQFTTDGDPCSTMSGNWQWNSAQYGFVSGTFIADAQTNCPMPPAVTFDSTLFEDL